MLFQKNNASDVYIDDAFINLLQVAYADKVNILNRCCEYYMHSLYKNNHILDYLINRRKFTYDTLSNFRIGFSPGDGSLLDYMYNIKIKDAELEELGIILNIGEQNNIVWHDIFTNRICFPIFDLAGSVAGFTARVWIDTQDKKAKYKNSILSHVFQKSLLMYNLHQALPHIKALNYVIAVEGTTDVAKMHQHGIKNVVAPCGTALMLSHILLLKSFTQNIIVVFDNDIAGVHALKRIENLFSEASVDFHKLDLWKVPNTNKTDPDSYLDYFGVNAFYKQIYMLFEEIRRKKT